jgi:steroid delta-isomerase-like uncharacterized protein
MANMEARMQMLEAHVRYENLHDLDGTMRTFGDTAHYDDEPWDKHYDGSDEVRGFYAALLHALPDMHINIRRRHASNDAIVVEMLITGTHRGTWRGLLATGRHVSFPLCCIFTFDENDRIAGEKIYYDRATVLRQLGVFFEPETKAGRVMTVLTHPATITRALGRVLVERH